MSDGSLRFNLQAFDQRDHGFRNGHPMYGRFVNHTLHQEPVECAWQLVLGPD